MSEEVKNNDSNDRDKLPAIAYYIIGVVFALFGAFYVNDLIRPSFYSFHDNTVQEQFTQSELGKALAMFNVELIEVELREEWFGHCGKAHLTYRIENSEQDIALNEFSSWPEVGETCLQKVRINREMLGGAVPKYRVTIDRDTALLDEEIDPIVMAKFINMIANLVLEKQMAQKELTHKRESEISELFKIESPSASN